MKNLIFHTDSVFDHDPIGAQRQKLVLAVVILHRGKQHCGDVLVMGPVLTNEIPSEMLTVVLINAYCSTDILNEYHKKIFIQYKQEQVNRRQLSVTDVREPF